MRTKTYLALMIFSLAIIGCKKKAEPTPTETQQTTTTSGTPTVATLPPDTIKPLSYLPAFPGSYWKYVTDKNDTVRYTTSSTYVKDSFDEDGKHKEAYVPIYNKIALWGYSGHTGPYYSASGSGVKTLVPIISEGSLGSSWSINAGSHYYTVKKIIAKDTTIQIAGVSYYPTIAIYVYTMNNGTEVPVSREYYTKDIGLIKLEDQLYSSSTVTEMHLVSYHINR